MKPIAQITRVVAVLLASSVLALTLWTPASAQLAPPDRNAVMLRVATFGNPVYMAGFSWAFSRQLDLVGTYSATSNAPTGNLWDAGVRYHFPVPTQGVDVFLGAGVANATAPFFTFGSASGFTAGGGATFQLSNLLRGYGSVNIVSLGGTTNSVLDVGAELQLTNRVSGQLGYINFAGTGEPYLGVSIALH